MYVCKRMTSIKLQFLNKLLKSNHTGSSAIHHTRSAYGKQLRNSSLTIKKRQTNVKMKEKKWKFQWNKGNLSKGKIKKLPYEQIQDILYVKGWLHKIT